MEKANRWYAVQETEDDAWDFGSENIGEAREMAREIARKNGVAYIAYIDTKYDFCDAEERIEYIEGEFETTYSE